MRVELSEDKELSRMLHDSVMKFNVVFEAGESVHDPNICQLIHMMSMQAHRAWETVNASWLGPFQ